MWDKAIIDIPKFGEPVLLDHSGSAQAFIVRLHDKIPGSVSNGDEIHFVAFSNVCTHMGCLLVSEEHTTVKYNSITGQLVCGPCPCHSTTFDLTRRGLVVQGPATQSLPQLELKIQDNKIVAHKWIGESDPRTETWPYF